MQREEIILKYIDKNGRGLEIGPSHNPVAPKHKGFNVEILDHLNKEDLIKKYEAHEVQTQNIEEVDYIWNGEPYSELIGEKNHYDWIIASHVIEHTPDFIDFINQCDSILKADGVLSLAVPDKRYCFDHFRPITGISKIIDNHLDSHSKHTIGSVVDFKLNTVSKSNQIAWGSNTSGNNFKFLYKPNDVVEYFENADLDSYVDVHAWCFTPHSFRLLIQDLNNLHLISLKEIDFYPTTGCEFFITLGRSGKELETSRMEMHSIIHQEIKQGLIDNETSPKNENWIKRNLRKLKKQFT